MSVTRPECPVDNLDKADHREDDAMRNSPKRHVQNGHDGPKIDAIRDPESAVAKRH